MANNPYKNKVIFGNQTVMDISDSTASESDVADGEVFYKGNGERAVGTGSYYSPTDATSTDIDDADYIPFYDNSASAKKNSLWSNIKAKLNEIFFTRSENNVLGAKNLLPKSKKTTDSKNGIDFTFNADGSVTFSGTASDVAEAYFDQTTSERLLVANLPSGIIVNGSDSSDSKYGIEVVYRDSSNDYISNQIAYNGDLQLVIPNNAYYIRVAVLVKSGTVISVPVTVYPMLRLASDPDNTFVPYAMTNKELTDKFGTLGSASTKDVPTSGDAGQTEVVLGNDSRLTDARTPTSHTHTISEITDFPTIPDELADLSDDSAHRLVTDTEKSSWNDKCDNSVIAPVESGATASRAYAVGEHFIRDGAFCTAKTAIASGAVFTLNTNYTAGNVAGEFEKTPDTVHELVPNISYTKKDGFVILDASGNTGVSITQGSWITLGTLPEGYRPTEPWSTMAGIGGNIDYYGVMRVTSAGKVQVYQNLTASSAVVYGNLTYPIQ